MMIHFLPVVDMQTKMQHFHCSRLRSIDIIKRLNTLDIPIACNMMYECFAQFVEAIPLLVNCYFSQRQVRDRFEISAKLQCS